MTDKLAVDGGPPLRTRPFASWPVFDEREERGLLEVLHSGRWGVFGGDKVTTFEKRFAEFQQARFGVCVPNGTQGLELSLRALGIGPGDEVITSPYTFVATASSVLTVGARPVFVDVDPGSLDIDTRLIEAAITARTRAIVPVHIGGRPADMDGVLQIARRHNLRVVEDACQAWGAAWRGQRVGAIGDLGAFSFQSSKNITSGEGGIVITNDPEIYELCWSLHNVGRIRDGAWYQHELLGWNLRMSEWQAAVLLVQLERLAGHQATRRANFRYLAEALSHVKGLTPLPEDPRVTEHGCHLFMLRYDPTAFGGRSRDAFVAAWRAEGITGCSAGYVPLHKSPAIRRSLEALYGILDPLPACPVAERAAEEVIWLFQYLFLGDTGDMDDIVAAARKIQQAWAQ